MKLDKIEYTEEHAIAVMYFSATAEELETAAQAVYERDRGKYAIRGYKKGEADRAAIEKARGEHVFWYEAINDIMDRDVSALLDAAVAENGLVTDGKPHYDLVSVKKDEGFVATASIALKPVLTLGQYKGLSADVRPYEITEKDVDGAIDAARSANAELVPHKGPAVKGNIVKIDFKGTVDGQPFVGGSADRQQVQLGSGRMIPGFEEGILGHQAGEEFDINVTFPANYPAKTLAGKEAVFHITLREVCLRQLPALNSDFAKKVGHGVETMEEYRAQVRANLEQGRHNTAMNKAKSDLMEQVGKNTTGTLCSLILEDAYSSQMGMFNMQLQNMQCTLAQYLQYTKQTNDEFTAQMHENSETQYRLRAAIQLICEAENMMPTDAEVDEEVAKRAERAKRTVEAYLKNNPREGIRRNMMRNRACQVVFDNATFVECDPIPVPKA